MTPHPLIASLFAEVDRRKLSHRTVAEGTGLSLGTLSHWRNGLRSPRIEELDKLVGFLNLKLEVIP